MSSHRLIVETAAQARRRKILMVAAGAGVLVGGWGLYWLGRLQAPDEARDVESVQQQADAKRGQLAAENRRLKAENRRLSERVTLLERSEQIDRVAGSELQESMKELQSRVAELKKELAFYRSIVSPAEAKAGLRIQGFRVDPTGEEGVYRFRLTLIQAMRHDREVSGRVRMRIEGLRGGESVSMSWQEVALDSGANLVFSFQYFQEIGGAFRVPAELDPTLIEVEVVPGSGGADTVAETYRWEDVIKARG